jgi:hypothetical protein
LLTKGEKGVPPSLEIEFEEELFQLLVVVERRIQTHQVHVQVESIAAITSSNSSLV